MTSMAVQHEYGQLFSGKISGIRDAEKYCIDDSELERHLDQNADLRGAFFTFPVDNCFAENATSS